MTATVIFLPMLMIAMTNPVHVVYVNEPNIDHSRRETLTAFSYWHELSPCNPKLSIVSETHLRMDDPYNFFDYPKLDRALGGNQTITLFIVNNKDTLQPFNLGGTYTGFALNDKYSRAIIVMTHYLDGNDNYYYPFIGMALAHELGHRLWALPDGRDGISIMNFPREAYEGWVIHPQDYLDIQEKCK